jgi:hypothetical protein
MCASAAVITRGSLGVLMVRKLGRERFGATVEPPAVRARAA